MSAGQKASLTVVRQKDTYQLEGRVLVVVLVARERRLGMAAHRIERGLVFSLRDPVTAQIDARRELLEDFTWSIFGWEHGQYFVSDQSSLWDFASEEKLNVLHARVRELYGVDVSDVNGAALWGGQASICEDC